MKCAVKKVIHLNCAATRVGNRRSLKSQIHIARFKVGSDIVIECKNSIIAWRNHIACHRKSNDAITICDFIARNCKSSKSSRNARTGQPIWRVDDIHLKTTNIHRVVHRNRNRTRTASIASTITDCQ